VLDWCKWFQTSFKNNEKDSLLIDKLEAITPSTPLSDKAITKLATHDHGSTASVAGWFLGLQL